MLKRASFILLGNNFYYYKHILFQGGELFAKRRKKADKWVVDESQIGMNAPPSQFADEFMAQQSLTQQQFHQEQQQEQNAHQQVKDEADAKVHAESQQIQQQQQQIFQEQQLMKQQQGIQIKQQQQQK
jgi:1,2-phenylacetyl-CoA epoxidase PaaB subunit